MAPTVSISLKDSGLQPEIEFAKDLYFPGEEVTGRVWMKTEHEKKVRKIDISFQGKAITTWRSKKDVKQAVFNKEKKEGEETFVEMKHEVWTPDDAENTLPSGEYEWNFSFELPRKCPPSFEGKFGFIRYWVKVDFDIPNLPDFCVERAVTVSPDVEVDSIEGSGEPKKVHVEKEARLCGCLPFIGRRGVVRLTVTISALGFVPGQSIRAIVIVENLSSKVLNKMHATLTRKVLYRETAFAVEAKPSDWTFSKFENTKIAERPFEQCGIAANGSKQIEFDFEIPPTVATIRSSQFISVEYFLTISAEIGLCQRVEAQLPIFIGNVPSMSMVDRPLRKFVVSEDAQCWIADLNPKFTYKVPYY